MIIKSLFLATIGVLLFLFACSFIEGLFQDEGARQDLKNALEDELGEEVIEPELDEYIAKLSRRYGEAFMLAYVATIIILIAIGWL